jgi:hypothetical protein
MARHQTRWHCISAKIPDNTPVHLLLCPAACSLTYELCIFTLILCVTYYLHIIDLDAINPPTQEYKLRSPIFNAVYEFDPQYSNYWVIMLDVVVRNAHLLTCRSFSNASGITTIINYRLHKRRQDGQYTYNVTLQQVCVTMFAEEERCYIFWMCVVALGIQLAKRTRRIILSSVACPALQYFPHYLIHDTIFGGRGDTEYTMCVLIFSNSNLILR